MSTQLPETTLIITMAGLGSRFRQAGYNVPKYEIEVKGRTLFSWSMESLSAFTGIGCPFVFVARREDQAGPFIEREAKQLGMRSADVVELEKLTDGQATSALLAAPVVRDKTKPVGVFNIDTFVDPRYLQPEEVRGSGWIPCFDGAGDKWSFVRVNGNGQVKEVREKQRISRHATVGFYWFDSFERYESAYHTYYSNPANIERSERYIAPLYNQLIADGHAVYMSEIPETGVHPLGTPEDVEVFGAQR